MSWKINIRARAEQDIEGLDAPIRRRVKEKLAWFLEHADETISLRLGFDLRGFFKLRVGDWRIMYEVKETEGEIIVHGVDHRSKVYKRK